MIVGPYDVSNVSCPSPLAFHSWWRCLMKSQMVFVLIVFLLSPRFQDFQDSYYPGFHFWTFPIYLLTGVLFLFTSAFCNSFVFYFFKMLWTRSLDPFQPSSSALELSTSASMRVKFYPTHVGANDCATTRLDSQDVWLVTGHTHSSFVSGVLVADATRNVWNRPSARETDGSSDSERSDSLAISWREAWLLGEPTGDGCYGRDAPIWEMRDGSRMPWQK